MDAVDLDTLSDAVIKYSEALDISGDNPGAWMEMQKLVKELRTSLSGKNGGKPETFSAIFKHVSHYNRAVAICERLKELFSIYTPKISGTSGLSVKTIEKYAGDLRKLSTMTAEPMTYDEYVPSSFSSADLKTISEIYESYVEKKNGKYVVDLYIAMLRSAMNTRGREVDSYLDAIKRDILEKGIEQKRDKAPNLPQFLVQRFNLVPEKSKDSGVKAKAPMPTAGSLVLYNLSEVEYSIANLSTRDAVLPPGCGITKQFLDATVTISALESATKAKSAMVMPKNSMVDILETLDGKTFHRLVGAGGVLPGGISASNIEKRAPSMRLFGYNSILNDVIFAKRGTPPEPENIEKINVDRIAEELVEKALDFAGTAKSSGKLKTKLCKDEFITDIIDTIVDSEMTIEVRLSFLQDELKLSRSLKKDLENAVSVFDAKPSRTDLLAMFRELIAKNINKRGTIIENMRKAARIFQL